MEGQITLWWVAASQQGITNPVVTEQEAQVTEQTSQTEATVEAPIEQGQVPQTEVPSEEPKQEEQKTLEEVAREEEIKKNEQENKEALDKIIAEANKDVTSPDVNVDDSVEVAANTDKLQEESDKLKQQLDEVKSLKDAETVAKKVYLAYEQEVRRHLLDNETNAQTIDNLKEVIKQLNAKTTAMDVDPRVVKLDDENYALYRIKQAYKANSSAENKDSLTKLYLTEIAVLHPEVNVNKLIAFMNDSAKKANNIWASTGTAAPIAEPVKPVERPRGVVRNPRWLL